MAELPDYYLDLKVDPKASRQEIERVYARRVAELRNSKAQDAPEELAEVEAAYAVLHDPASRAGYDAKVRAADQEAEKKEAELNAYLKTTSHRRRQRNRRAGFLGALLDLLELFK